jgi:integrase
MTDKLAKVADVGQLALFVESANAYAASAKARNTRRAYEADAAAFDSWCKSHGLVALPATPGTVATYLASLADSGRKASTIERALAGIAHAYRSAGHPWEKGAHQVREVMAGIRRGVGTAPAQKAPVEEAELVAMMSKCSLDNLAGLRDRAVIALGWFGAFRRSELVALDVTDVRFVRNGLVVRLRRSKTDQEAQGAEKAVAYQGDGTVCPVRAVKDWLDAAKLTVGPLFRGIDRHGNMGVTRLSDKTVERVVKRVAEAAGLDPKLFAGHSLRAGFATTAARKGKGLDAIMRQTGHRSERVARRYIRHGTLFVDNATAKLF